MSMEKRMKAELDKSKIDAGKLVALMLADHSLIDSTFHELTSKFARIKFGCAKSLLVLSEKRPDLLLPKTDKILELLGSENQILEWNAIAILGNLATVDPGNLRGILLPKLYAFLSGGELIAANHAIAALANIGRAFPREQKKITANLLAIEDAVFKTDECRNIAIGKTILALATFLDPGNTPKEVIEFARRHTVNQRPATAKKAEYLLRKLENRYCKAEEIVPRARSNSSFR
jgi:hypothetical protein